MDIFEKCYQYTQAKEVMKEGFYPYFIPLDENEGTEVEFEGHRLIMCGSNNYLGLTTHPKVKEAAIKAIERYGTSCTGSRFLNGTLALHEQIEAEIADFVNKGSALIFSTGMQVNLGTISALAGRSDVVVLDKDDHASIVDGCRLSKAETKIYPHKDVAALEKILGRALHRHGRDGYNNIFLISDGIFSMDGDIAPLPALLEIADRYNALLILDDAHGTGVLGKNGGGTSEYFDIAKNQRLIQVGTFSKALGSLGGYVAGPEIIIDFLRNSARSFIYSTALPPSVSASSIAALDVLENDRTLLQSLRVNIAVFSKGLTAMGYTVESQTPIIPIITGAADLTMKFADALLKKGILAPGIRPPTVPDNKSRIRVSIMATHTKNQIERALSVFEEEGKLMGII